MRVRNPIPPVQVRPYSARRATLLAATAMMLLLNTGLWWQERMENDSLRAELAVRCERPTVPTQVTVSFPDGGCLTREFGGSASAKPVKSQRTG